MIVEATQSRYNATNGRSSRKRPCNLGQSEVSFGAAHVFEYLRLQRLGRRPLNLAAQAEQKLELQGSLIADCYRLEVEDVGLYAEAGAVEGWPIAHICDGVKALPGKGDARDINTECGQKAVVRSQIDSRNQQFGTDATSLRRI